MKHPDTRTPLRKDRCKRRSADAEATGKNKYRIQHDIDHGSDQNGVHPNFCKSLCRNKHIHSQCQLNKYRTDGINIKIADRIFNCIFAGSECKQKCLPAEQHNHCQHDGNKNLQGKTIADNFFCRLRIAFSQKDRSPRSTAISHERRKSRQNHNKRHTYAYSRERKRPHFRNMTDINPVHDIIKHIDHLRDDSRNRKSK